MLAEAFRATLSWGVHALLHSTRSKQRQRSQMAPVAVTRKAAHTGAAMMFSLKASRKLTKLQA